ncbi:folate-binding protein [Deinococcus sp. VB142]|uniref:Folate-binding protein n=1 Tax=Deinococcus sp. VB142 TaxID=3112952 RepID=A0AAU6Q587_9DEIO
MWTRLPSSALRVTGADRTDFVHGQMTGDLRGAPTPGVVPCAFLNVRGQIEQFAYAYKRPDDIYLHLGAGEAQALAARLKRYIIFDQVELHDLSDTLRTVHVWQQDVPGWDAAGPAAQQWTLGGSLVLGGRVGRGAEGGVDLHYLARDEQAVLEALGGEERPLSELSALRVAAGLPDVLADDFVGALPQEVGLDVGGPLTAISYRKGCYVGQEIMARIEARGQTRFHLARLLGTGLPSHTDIHQGERVVGRTGQSADGAVLARLRREIADGDTVQVGGVQATVQWIPHA